MDNSVEQEAGVTAMLLNQIEIAVGWNMLFAAIVKSEIYSDIAQVSNMLFSAHAGRMQCWLLKGDGLKGVVITQMFRDPVSRAKRLMIVHANSLESITDEEWCRIYEALQQYAYGEGCSEFEVYTQNARAKNILRDLGFGETSMFRKAV